MSQVNETFHPVVVTPTFNNARTLPGILQRIHALGYPIICVNDGSTDDTAEILAGWSDRARVGTLPWNMGKAAALHVGFIMASQAGFTHAVTIDTDGQLDPEQIPEMLRLAEQSPQALVLGFRDETKVDYPAKSRMGRRISNMLVLIESGKRVSDSQCGLRVYPLGLMNAVRVGAGHFGFETEIITRAAWAGCAMIESPVRCRYLPIEQRVSHFKPWRDSLRALWMHLRLVLRAMNPWPHPKWPKRDCTSSAAWSLKRPRQLEFLHRLWNWISPVEAWRQVREDQVGRNWFALSFAVGVFIANLPLYGVQTIMALYTAKRLHLQPLGVVAGSHISTPPINFALIAGAIALGHLMLHGTWMTVDLAHVKVRSVIVDWIVGGIVLGLVLGAISFFVVACLLRFVPGDPRLREYAQPRLEEGEGATSTS